MDATQPASTARDGSRRPARFWISLAMLAGTIFLYVLLVSGRNRQPTGTSGPAIGRSLSYFHLQRLTGDAEPIGLAELRGHVTLVNFWGTWCPPCIRELPEILALAESYRGDDRFRLLAVSCGQAADDDLSLLAEQTESFLGSRGLQLSAYADESAATRRALAITLGMPLAYPTTLILDAAGTVRGFWQGYDPRAARDMRRLIDQLLAEME